MHLHIVIQAPCMISPYHYRLDWQMWFAAFQKYQQNPWLVGSLLLQMALYIYLSDYPDGKNAGE